MSDYVPDAGDIIWISLDPRMGHEQAGRRPFLVLSQHDYNAKTALAVGCPITTHRKNYPFEVQLPTDGAIVGVVLADQVKSLDWRARNAELADRAVPSVMRETLDLLGLFLNITSME